MEVKHPMHRFAREVCLGLVLGGFGLCLSGCGGSEPPAPTKTDEPKPAVVEAPKSKIKGKGKRKGGDPTADMELEEVREYRRTHPTGAGAP